MVIWEPTDKCIHNLASTEGLSLTPASRKDCLWDQMSQLSRLVEDLHLREDRGQVSNRRGTKDEVLLEHALGSCTKSLLGPTSVGKLDSQCRPFGHASRASLELWNGVPHIEDLQRSLLDPTSHVTPYPPLDLDTRLAAIFDVQRKKSSCVPQKMVPWGDGIRGLNSAKLTCIHRFILHLSACCECQSTDSTSAAQPILGTTPSPVISGMEYQSRPQAPNPSKAYHEITESSLWTQPNFGFHQDQSKVLPKSSRRNERFYYKERQNIFSRPLLGSSVADLSDNSTLPSFRTTVSPPQEELPQKDGQNHLETLKGGSHQPLIIDRAKPATQSHPQTPADTQYLIESKNSTDWEALVADADLRFEDQGGNVPTWEAAIKQADCQSESEPSVKTTIRRQPCRQTNSASQSILTEQKHESLEGVCNAPIPLDYNKPQAPRTPSVHTQGSVLDCTSPSFPKSVNAKLRSVLRSKETNALTTSNLRKASELSDHDSQNNGHIEKWLESTESVEYTKEVGLLDEIGKEDSEKASFPVWLQNEEAGVTSGAFGPQLSSQLALRDMTSLRQPRYLEKNSFFRDREKNGQHSPGFIPTPARAADYKRTLAILEGRHPQHARESVPTRSRSAEFESTLASLEGRR